MNNPVWKQNGAANEKEWAQYIKYYQALDQKAYAEYYNTHPDEDPEDFQYEVDAMSFVEWKEANK